MTVNVTGVVVSAYDDYDETGNGKDIGTVFVQDADEAVPFGGISLYESTYVPANLRVAPGDVLNVLSEYTEQHTIGSDVNFGTQFLPQMYKPQVSPSFEVPTPTPLVVTLDQLSSWDTARPLIGLLVELDNVTVPSAPAGDGSGRFYAALTSTTGGPELANELMPLQTYLDGGTFAAGTTFSKIIGVIDYFYTIYVCPRSPADLVE